LTEYSGITKETLKGVTTTLHDVQKQLQQLIGTETILIGHGLHNDLRQLKVKQVSLGNDLTAESILVQPQSYC